MELKLLEESELLKFIYSTLCSEYEDEKYYSNLEDQHELMISRKRLTNKLFYEIKVDNEYFLTMDTIQFEENYAPFEEDFKRIIRECCKNDVGYDRFLILIDELLVSASARMAIFTKLKDELNMKETIVLQKSQIV